MGPWRERLGSGCGAALLAVSVIACQLPPAPLAQGAVSKPGPEAPPTPPTPVPSPAARPEPAGLVTGTEVPPTLRVGLMPNQSPERVRTLYAPFQRYLSASLGRPVELVVAADTSAVVRALGAGRIDLAYFSDLAYVLAERQVPIYPIVTEVDRETRSSKYYSAIITRADSPIQRVADIKGRTFAFGELNSTAGSLYPRVMLSRAGLSGFDDPRFFLYTGSHEATAQAVLSGRAEAGGLERRVLTRLIEAGQVDRSKLRIVAEMLVEGYPWCVRSKLDPGLVQRIIDAFLGMSDPDLLRLMRAVRYVRVGPAEYGEVRSEAVRQGLLR